MGGLPLAVGRAGIAAALLVAIAALCWPTPQPDRLSASLTACPLGYISSEGRDVKLPAGHPAVSLPIPQLLIFTNATIWTGDPQDPWAEAMAIRGGRLEAVGSAEALAKLQQDAGGSSVDLQGRFVVPGFIDAHVHLIPGGLSLVMVDLSQARSKTEFTTIVKSAAEMAGPGQWLTGGGWNEQRWGGGLPAAAWIDSVTPHNPAYLTRMDGHSALANTAAMQISGIGGSTPDPEAGHITRTADGAANGILAESAMLLVSERVPPLTLEARTAAVLRAAEHALSHGITTVHDMGRPPFMGGPEAAWEDLEGPLVAAAESGELPIRVFAFMPLSTWQRTAAMVAERGVAHAGGRLFWGGVKAFSDGSLGSRTALMHQPYADDASSSGMLVTPLEELRHLVLQADAAGLQIAIHAIGDRAVDDVTDILRSATRTNIGRRAERRHRIEHVQHLSSPAAAATLSESGILAVLNPLHLLEDKDVMIQRLGPERSGAGRAFALNTLGKAGVLQAYGSDWPVVPLGALRGIYAAAHRRVPGTSDVSFVETECVQTEIALRAHTTGAAHAAFMEHEVGMLRPAMRADFVVLSESPLESASDNAFSTDLPVVLQTFVDGLCAYGCQQ